MTLLPARPGRLSRDGRQVTRFAYRLGVLTGIDVGVRWRASTTPHRFGKDWQITWSNGPTVEKMRDLARRLADHTGSVNVDRLQWSRVVLPTAFGLALIRNLRAGRGALGDAPTYVELLASLDDVDYPEHGTARDVQLAERLARLGDQLEPNMLRFLETYGLPGLGEGEFTPGANITALARLQNDADRPLT